MPKRTPDEGHRLTDKELAELEKRIAKIYKQAADEVQDTITRYFESFAARDEEMKKLIGTKVNGKEWTETDYKLWRLAQIGRGKRFEALRDKLAERYTNANTTAIAYTNDATPGIYSLNRNYAAYTIEQVAGDVDFTLWDEQTVKRLIVEQPELMPYYPKKRALKRGIDLDWGKKQITASVNSAILQGKSVKGIADDLQRRIETMNRDSAIRTARTAVTGAQNAGRMDSYKAAEKMGIEMEREWVATLDGRTRHDHAMADGQVVGVDEPFTVGGYKIMYPGDPKGKPQEVYNCRCTQIARVKGVDTGNAKRRAIDPETGESVLIDKMTYAEWAGWKEKGSKQKIGVKEPKKHKFVPASTIKEAEEYAKKFGIDADYSEYDISVANAVNKTAERIVDEFGDHSLGALKKIGKDTRAKKREGGFDEFEGKLSLSGTKRKDALFKMGERTRKANARYQKMGMNYFSADDDMHTIYHEFGHIVHVSVGGSTTSTASTALDREIISFMRDKNTKVLSQVSYYATINHEELISECVAQYLVGNQSEIAIGIVNILKKYGLKIK